MRVFTLLVVAALGYLAHAVETSREPPRAPAGAAARPAPVPERPCGRDVVRRDDESADESEPVFKRVIVVEPEAAPAPTGVLRGTIVDAHTGERVAGVTVVVTSLVSPPRTTLSDEHGEYEVGELPSASFHVAFYYADVRVERDGIGVSELDPTTLDVTLDGDGDRAR